MGTPDAHKNAASRTAASRRALLLFERMLDLPPGSPERNALFAGESADILAEVAALEAVAARTEGQFATEVDDDPDAPAPARPDRLGVYALEELIGEGGMGEVWRAARDDGLFEHQVAAKLIRPGIASPAAEARFAEERRLLARLNHPGVARIIDGGVADGWPYLLTELVEGSTIDAHCEARQSPLRDRVALVRQAAAAVQAAHGQLIVHADIKPGNLLVTGDGQVRLVDFGISRLIGGEAERRPGLQPMTRAYASPERLAGALPDVADDIHALGIVLRDLAGEGADAGIAAIVARAIAGAKDRYPTMEALGADLDRWLADLPVRAHPRGWRYRAGLFARRHRFGVVAAGIALLALLAAAAIGVAGHLRAERARAAEAARIADLRSVSHYLLFDLQAEMARQPNSLAMRARIAEQLQTYLDRMAGDPRATPTIRLEAAQGLLRLADQQGNPAQANLGQPAQARRNLERAGRLAAGLPGGDAALLRARIAMDLARVLTMNDHDLKRADALLTEAGRDIAAAGPAGRAVRGTWLTEVATLRAWQNRYADSVASARAAMRAPPPADPRDAALLAARMQDILAESLFYQQDVPAALTHYRQQLAILEAALKRWPDDAKVRRYHARALWALGSTLIETQQWAEALAMLEAGTREARALVTEDRDNADAERMLRIIEIAQAQALAGTGRTSEGVAVLRASVDGRKAAWLERPRDAMRLRDYAIGIAAYGDILAEAGRAGEACRSYDDAEALFDRLKRRGQYIAIDRDYSHRLLSESRAKHCR